MRWNNPSQTRLIGGHIHYRLLALPLKPPNHKQQSNSMKPQIFLIVLVVLALFSCRKPLPEEKLSYEGVWHSEEMKMHISANGTLAYKRFRNNSTTSINGTITTFEGDDFRVGVGPIATTFVVSKPPHQVDGTWVMVVDGVLLTKITN